MTPLLSCAASPQASRADPGPVESSNENPFSFLVSEDRETDLAKGCIERIVF